MKIQIYAFTQIEDALQAIELGVDHIGFVAGEYGQVHGELSFSQARSLRDAIRTKATAVALSMATDPAEIARMAEAVRPDILHISTEPEQVGREAMAALHRDLPGGTAIMKAVPVAGETSLKLADRFAPVSDYLLLDTKVEGLPGVGATGATHDWTISRRIVERVSIPVILAGGLSPENVAEAIAVVRPWGVDSNSATNIPGDPVRKDLDNVAAFVQAARSGPA